MAVLVGFLRKQRVQVYPDLNDWLIRDRTRAQVKADIRLILSTFQKFGLLLNMQKWILSHIQRIEFIGAVLDSVQVRAFLLDARP